jgi:glutathione peroxidase
MCGTIPARGDGITAGRREVARMTQTISDIPLRRIDGTETSLSAFRGNVVLVVNVASQCGLTPQYAGLEALYARFRDQGLVVAGFPANEFGAQEPGSNEEIASFCSTKFNVTFPMFEKIVVKGDDVHPLYAMLTSAQPKATEKPESGLRTNLAKHGLLDVRNESDILWNFEKFVLSRDGRVVARFAPDIAPDDALITSVLEAELAKA